MTQELVRTQPDDWAYQMAITEEDYLALWERAATVILDYEDEGIMRPTVTQVYRELNERFPGQYSGTCTQSLRDRWWKNPQWQMYLATRRQEHYLVTMPTRLQILKYHGRILDLAGSELVARLHQDPASFTPKELATILKDSTSAVGMLERDIRVASGEDTGNQISINLFQFLDKLPPAKARLAAAAVNKELVRAKYEVIDD